MMLFSYEELEKNTLKFGDFKVFFFYIVEKYSTHRNIKRFSITYVNEVYSFPTEFVLNNISYKCKFSIGWISSRRRSKNIPHRFFINDKLFYEREPGIDGEKVILNGLKKFFEKEIKR